MATLIIRNIKWDTDGENVDLPEEVVIKNPSEKMLDKYSMADAISEYLSDTYEFCVYGFDIDSCRKPEIKKVMEELRNAWMNVSDLFNKMDEDELNDIIVGNYPFHRSFDEMTIDVLNWIENADMICSETV